MSNSYIKSLDGIRAAAIILVMTFHAGINHFGWMGVQLFFVLSGYLITGILWKEKFQKEMPANIDEGGFTAVFGHYNDLLDFVP